MIIRVISVQARPQRWLVTDCVCFCLCRSWSYVAGSISCTFNCCCSSRPTVSSSAGWTPSRERQRWDWKPLWICCWLLQNEHEYICCLSFWLAVKSHNVPEMNFTYSWKFLFINCIFPISSVRESRTDKLHYVASCCKSTVFHRLLSYRLFFHSIFYIKILFNIN